MDFGHCLYKRTIYLLCSISNSRNPQFIVLYIWVLTFLVSTFRVASFGFRVVWCDSLIVHLFWGPSDLG